MDKKTLGMCVWEREEKKQNKNLWQRIYLQPYTPPLSHLHTHKHLTKAEKVSQTKQVKQMRHTR